MNIKNMALEGDNAKGGKMEDHYRAGRAMLTYVTHGFAAPYTILLYSPPQQIPQPHITVEIACLDS